MKEETEITVKVNCSYEKLHLDLLKQGFKIIDKLTMIDYYMINENLNIENMKIFDILNNCILVRDFGKLSKALLYKHKEYDKNGNLVKDEKLNCEVEDINTAIEFMKKLQYYVLFDLKDEIIVYSNDIFEFVVQKVNNNIYIELEDESRTTKHKFNTIDEMKCALINLNIDYDKSNYFVSKAKIVLEEKLGR